MPGTDYIGDSLTLRRDDLPNPTQWPKLTCGQANQLALTNASDLRLEADREVLFQGAGQIRAQGDLRILTGAAPGTEKLRILANGNVGIGTASPGYKLDVSGDLRVTGNASVGGNLQVTGTITGNLAANAVGSGALAAAAVITDKLADGSVTAAKLAAGAITGDKLVAGVVTTDKLANGSVTATKLATGAIPACPWTNVSGGINYAGGNVGIGMPTPIYKLHVGTGDKGLRIEGPATAGGTSVSLGGNGDFAIDAPGVVGGRFVVKDIGNVGIGTGSPRHKLQIGGDVDGIGLDPSDASPNAGYIRFGDNTGWKLHIGRSREKPEAGINTGVTGVLMTIQDNGNVGIGTANPVYKLHVVGTSLLGGPNYNSHFPWNDNNVYITGANIIFRDGAPNGWAERMRITSAGNVGIGTANPQARLHASGNAGVLNLEGTDHAYIQWYPQGMAAGRMAWMGYGWQGDKSFTIANDVGRMHISGTERLYLLNKSGVIVGQEWGGTGVLTVEGDLWVGRNAFKPGGGAWAASSDRSLKQNVQPMHGVLDKLLKLRGVNFEWKEPEKQGNLTGTQMGLVAQEVEDVFPEWVGTGPDGLKFVAIRGFEALTIEAFRELKTEVDRLRSVNQALEKRVKVLETRLKPQ